MKTKARIVKRTYPAGEVEYVIQTKCLWFFWVDAVPPSRAFSHRSRFSNLEQAQKNLWVFDGTPKHIDEVVRT